MFSGEVELLLLIFVVDPSCKTWTKKLVRFCSKIIPIWPSQSPEAILTIWPTVSGGNCVIGVIAVVLAAMVEIAQEMIFQLEIEMLRLMLPKQNTLCPIKDSDCFNARAVQRPTDHY